MATALIVMGVAACGKTTFGRALAARLSYKFFDADDFHSPSNIQKMSHGEPLTDADREPWLDNLARLIAVELTAGRSLVLACSALKQTYRDHLAVPALANQIRFLWLRITPELAEQRLRSRAHHYMPASLVASQFATLEPPSNAIELDAAKPLPELLVLAVRNLSP